MTARPWWRRDLEEHAQVDGECPRCRTRKRCWPWAEAFAASLLAERWPQP